jgi:aminoacrylate hydrolase
MPKVRVADTELYYETHGEGLPLMLVAGLGGTGSYWAPQIASYARQYKVIVHDHRGTGQSERSPITYSVEQMAADTLGLMDVLGIEHAYFVGHSTGGAIGQILAVEHPRRLRSLVLADSWTKADGFFRWCFEVRKELLLKSGVAAYQHAAPLFLYPPWYINAHADRIRRDQAASVAGFTTVAIAASRIDAILAFDRTKDLAAIRVPTLVICAKDDNLTPPYFSKELADAIPGAQLKVLETGGHACSQTVPEDFDRAVLEFLKSVP